MMAFSVIYHFLLHTCSDRWNQEGQLACYPRHSEISTFAASQLNLEETLKDLKRH